MSQNTSTSTSTTSPTTTENEEVSQSTSRSTSPTIPTSSTSAQTSTSSIPTSTSTTSAQTSTSTIPTQSSSTDGTDVPLPPLICHICGVRDLSHIRDQPENIERHIKKCTKDKENDKRKRKGQVSIMNMNFFKKKKQNMNEVEVEEVVDDSIGNQEVEIVADTDIVDGVEVGVEESDGDYNDTTVDGANGGIGDGDGDGIEYCEGVDLTNQIGNVYSNFPFQLLETCTFVFSNGKFHSEECSFKHYVYDGTGPVNWTCGHLVNASNMKKIIKRSQEEIVGSEAPRHNFIYLTYRQLSSKIEALIKDKSLQRLERYKVNNKLERLNKTLSLHQRLLVQISENNVPRLQGLVNVALKNNRSISYIVEKVTQAINGVYKARPSQDDRDLAFLVLKFGGPSLLSILYHANVLPSVSLAYKISKNSVKLALSVTFTFRQCCEENLKTLKKMQMEDPQLEYSFSIITDETYINDRLRYNCKTNEIVGICYEHHDQVNLQFNSLQDAQDLKDKLEKKIVHCPKECMVTGCSSLVKNIPFQVVLMWPTCSKDDFDRSCEMFVTISQCMKETLGMPAMNFNSDGDPTRRQAFNAITKHDLDMDSDLGKIIEKLHLVDRKVGKNNETVNFDAKHVAKRCWTGLISEKMEVNKVVVNKHDLSKFLENSDTRTHNINTLVHPTDKQNVPCATDMLLSFICIVNDEDKQKRIPFKFTPVLVELKMVGAVYEAVICLYSYVNMSLTEQISTVAKGAVCLLALNRSDRLVIPNQLYHDIQCTFIDTVFCVAKKQIHSPESPFYSFLNGTDPGERYFGNTRIAFGHKNLDSYELQNSASSISNCDAIMIKHPAWIKKSRVSRRLVLDHSNTSDWKGDLIVGHVDIPVAWECGVLDAMKLIVQAKIEFNLDDLTSTGITLRKPLGKLIGVKERSWDWSSLEATVDTGSQPSATESEPVGDNDADMSELIEAAAATNENYVDVDGKNVFKATILREMSKDNKPLSNDRLRKVRGLSKYVGEDHSSSMNMNDALSIGDPLVVYHNKKLKMVIVTNMRDGDEMVKFLPRTDLERLATKVEVRELKMLEVESNLFSTGTYQSERMWINGKECICIEPEVSANPPEGCTAYFFNKQLIQDVGVHIALAAESAESASSSTAGSSSSSGDQQKCKICKKMVSLANMRKHVGKHIVKADVPSSEKRCGFCGAEGCTTRFEEGSHNTRKFFRPQPGGCAYFYLYKKVGEKATRNVPCTNRMVFCPACNLAIWSYNLQVHYENQHPDDPDDTPASHAISDNERKFMKKLKV